MGINEVIICGKPIPISGVAGKGLVNYDELGAFSFPAKNDEYVAANKGRLYAGRVKKGRALKVEETKDIKELVTQVVLHTDLTINSSRCFAALLGRGLSTHFMVDWDGTIWQTLDIGYQAFHGGFVNSISIGIDLNNRMHNLKREPNAPQYPADHPAVQSSENKKKYNRPRSRPDRINFGHVQSYGYTDDQYHSLIKLLALITQEDHFYSIERAMPFDASGEIVKNMLDDFKGFSGIVAHWHVSGNRWDPGPGFDWQRVYDGIVSQNNSFPIVLNDEKTLGSLRERHKVEDHAELYYELNEVGLSSEPQTGEPTGGWYPVGRNQTWHGGVHLQKKEDAEVLSMFGSGRLVAARFHQRETRLGSNNFVLLRHEIEIPGREKDKKKQLIFWVLYMHLAAIDFENPASWPEWLKQLVDLDKGREEAKKAAIEKERKEREKDEEPKKKKRRKKKKKKDEDEDEDEEEEASGDGDDEEGEDEFVEELGEFQTMPSRVGEGLGELTKGRIAFFPWEESPIIVGPGKPLGRVGRFGTEDEKVPQVHVEVFADDRWKDAIDLAVHGQFFTEVQQANVNERSLFVKNRGLLAAFNPSGLGGRKKGLVKDRIVAEDEIVDLYSGTDDASMGIRRRLRKVACYSLSEWADTVDWVASLTEAEDWNGKLVDFKKLMRSSGLFRKALERVLPFIWFTGEIAEKIGFQIGEKWTGLVWHFHPIHFLLWLTYRASRNKTKVSRSVSKKEWKKRRKEEKKQQEDDEKSKSDLNKMRAGFAEETEIDDQDTEALTIEEVLQDWFMAEPDQGDWREVRSEEED